MDVIKEIKIGGLTLKVCKGDITRCGAEAIVNAANSRLEHGGGVALAIAKAATDGRPEEYTRISKDEMRKQIGKDEITHGEVVVTPGMALERFGTRFVIHTVGPICGGRWGEDFKKRLKAAIAAPLKKADELGVKSIAYPAVSAGIYGCPLEEVVRTMIKVFREQSKDINLREIYLVLYDDESVRRALEVV